MKICIIQSMLPVDARALEQEDVEAAATQAAGLLPAHLSGLSPLLLHAILALPPLIPDQLLCSTGFSSAAYFRYCPELLRRMCQDAAPAGLVADAACQASAERLDASTLLDTTRSAVVPGSTEPVPKAIVTSTHLNSSLASLKQRMATAIGAPQVRESLSLRCRHSRFTLYAIQG